MWIRRLSEALLALGVASSLGCQVTMAELQAQNPEAMTLEVPCRPSEVPDSVKVMAFRMESGHIVTDETPSELLSFAPLASVFIEFRAAAPDENADVMASAYGLSCPKETRYSPSSSKSSEDNARRDAHYVGQLATATSATTSLPRIAVCARPPGITSDTWYGGPGIDGTTTNADAHAKEVAKATVIFYLDPSAPPESVWNFGKNTKVRCNGKNAPIPYDEWIAQNTGTASGASGSTNAGTSSASTTTTTTTTKTRTKKKGDETTTSTSSPAGQGPPLSTFEAIARNLAIGGALSQMDTSGSLKDPNGDRHGIPGGKNVGGFSFPLLQAGVATLQILSSAGMSPKSFVEDIVKFAKRGQRTLIKEADAKVMQVADDLIKNHGQYEMAKGLQEMQTIMPYALSEKFTANLGGKFQAHKIFEKQAFEKVLKMDGKALKEAVGKAPSIILTEAQHKKISDALAAGWKELLKKPKITKADLRAHYEAVYKTDHPQWLDAIESYLR